MCLVSSGPVRDAFFLTLGGFKRFKRLKLCFKRIIAIYNFLKYIIKVINLSIIVTNLKFYINSLKG